LDTLTSTFGKLKSRLEPSRPARPPTYAVICNDPHEDWAYIYQALFMGQLMETGDEKWQFYYSFNEELPSEEEL